MSEKNSEQKGGKALKIISIIFLSFALLIMGALFVADVFLDDYLKDRISREVKEGTDGLYELEMDDLNLSLRTFRIRIDGINFSTNEDLHRQHLDTLGEDDAAMPFMNITADRLTISQFNLWSFLFANRIHLSALRFHHPVAHIRLFETEEDFDILNLHNDIEGIAESILLNTLELDSAYLDIEIQDGNDWNKISLSNARLLADDVFIDSTAAYDEDRFIYSERVQLSIKDSAIFNLVGMYSGSLGSLHADTDEGLQIRNLLVNTNDELYQQKADQRRLTEPYISLSMEELDLATKDWGVFILGGVVHAEHLLVHNSDIEFIAPPTGPGKGAKETGSPGTNGFQVDLHEGVNTHFFTLTMDSIRIRNTKIHALIPDGPDTTEVSVPDLNIYMTDIKIDSAGANDPERFMYAIDASILTREGIVVKQGNDLSVSTDMFLMASDSGVFVNNIKVQGRALDNSTVTMESLNVNFTEWPNLQHGEPTHIESIALNRPNVNANIQVNGNNGGNGNGQRGFQMDLHQDVNDIVPLLTIGSFAVNHASIRADVQDNDDHMNVAVPDLNLNLTNIRLDDQGAKDPNRFMYASNVAVNASHGIAVRENGELLLSTDHLQASTDRGLSVRNVRYPGDAELEASLESLTIGFTQWGRLQQGLATHVQSIAVNRPVIRANMEIEVDEEDVEESPQERGFRMEFHKELEEFVALLTIGNVSVSNADIQATLHGEEEMYIEVPNLDINVAGIRLDSAAAYSSERFMYASSMSFNATKGLNFKQNENIAAFADNFMFSTDSGLFVNNLHIAATASPELNASLDALQINFTEWGELQQGEATHVKGIALIEPHITAHLEAPQNENGNGEENDQEPAEGFDPKMIPAELSEFVALLTIGNFTIESANLDIEMDQGEEEEEPMLIKTRGLTLSMDDIRLDSAAAESPERFFFADHFELGIDVLETRPTHLYDISLENFAANSSEQTLNLHNFKLKPRYEKIVFAEVVGEETQRMDLEVGILQIEKLDYQALMEMDFVADLIQVSDFDWEIFVDRHVPSEEPQPPLFPHDQLTTLDFKIDINRIKLKNGYIEYEELAEGGHTSGAFTFEDFHATAYDVLNRPTEGYEHTTIDFTFDLMGTGDFHGQLLLAILDPEKYFSFSGGMDQLNLEKLNPALEYIAFTRIEEGQMHHFRFEGEGNRHGAQGELHASYEGLSIELLEEGPEEPGFPTTVISSIADRLVNTDNIEGTDDFTPGDMDVERREGQPFLGLILDSLNQGLFDSFGVGNIMDIMESIERRVPFIGDASQ
ncbi:MAG: hypothetical protein ACK4ND_02395 [Cytophagaceae bacterium]